MFEAFRGIKKTLTSLSALTLAKCVFLTMGYVLYFVLPRFLSVEEFGRYSVVAGLVSLFNMILITGIVQAVSKYVSEEQYSEYAVKTAAIKIQSVMGIGILLLLLLGTLHLGPMPSLIGTLFRDEGILFAVRISAFIPLCYALYGITIGFLNGRKQYTRQASLDIGFSILKTLLMISAAIAGLGIEGCFSGFAGAAFIMLMVSQFFLVSRHSDTRQQGVSWKELFRFQFWVILLTCASNLLLSADLFMIKILSDPHHASSLAGYYNSGLVIARIPFYFSVAASSFIYPMVSKASSDNDLNRIRKYTQSTLTGVLILIVPFAVWLSVSATEILAFIYPAGYSIAGQSLGILAIGMLALVMFLLSMNIMTGDGKPSVAFAFSVITLSIQALLCMIFIPQNGLIGAAWSSTVAWVTGFVASQVYLSHRFKISLNPKLLSVIAIWAFLFKTGASFLDISGLSRLIVTALACLITYPVSLWVFRRTFVRNLH